MKNLVLTTSEEKGSIQILVEFNVYNIESCIVIFFNISIIFIRGNNFYGLYFDETQFVR